MSVFSAWLQSELDAQGWDQRQAAGAIRVRESSIHNWLHKGVIPKSPSLIKIAMATGTPIEDVMQAAGFPDLNIIRKKAARADARAKVLASLPQFAEIIDRVARQTPAKQAAYIEMIKRIIPPQDREERDQESTEE